MRPFDAAFELVWAIAGYWKRTADSWQAIAGWWERNSDNWQTIAKAWELIADDRKAKLATAEDRIADLEGELEDAFIEDDAFEAMRVRAEKAEDELKARPVIVAWVRE